MRSNWPKLVTVAQTIHLFSVCVTNILKYTSNFRKTHAPHATEACLFESSDNAYEKICENVAS